MSQLDLLEQKIKALRGDGYSGGSSSGGALVCGGKLIEGGKFPKGKLKKEKGEDGQKYIVDHPEIASWQEFRAKNKDKGWDMSKMSIEYRKLYPKQKKTDEQIKAENKERAKKQKEREAKGLVKHRSERDLEILRLKREAKVLKGEARLLEGKPVSEKLKKTIVKTKISGKK